MATYVGHCCDKIPEKATHGRKDLFLLMLLEVSFNCQLMANGRQKKRRG
jgi:hypothetical protein